MFVRDRKPPGSAVTLIDRPAEARKPHCAVPRNLSSALVEIEERIDGIECELALVAPLVHERARLLRARAAILGDPPSAPEGSDDRASTTREDVFAYLIRNPGSRAGDIAEDLGAGRHAVSAHLQRGKGRMFSTQAGRWYPIPAADMGSAPEAAR